jgi:hypothetical protein
MSFITVTSSCNFSIQNVGNEVITDFMLSTKGLEFRNDVDWSLVFFHRYYNGTSYIPELMWSAPDTILSTEACLNGLGGVNLHWSL